MLVFLSKCDQFPQEDVDMKKFWYERLFDRLGDRYLDKDYTRGTVQEVDFLVQLFGKDRSQRILDVGCGPGRHILELAGRGYRLTGIDLCAGFLHSAAVEVKRRGQTAYWVRADARRLPFSEKFDWTICLCEGAFGILENDGENQKVLEAIARGLKPGGRLLLNVLHAAFAIRHPEIDQPFDVTTCRGFWIEHYETESGEPAQERCSVRYYTLPEIEYRLHTAGLSCLAAWGARAGRFRRAPLRLDDFEMVLLAQKEKN